MALPILATKLYIPAPPPGVVRRPRLVERLDSGLHRKLTLIAAPAGFGKTTLLTSCLAGGSHKLAWLSLDEADSEPVRFLTYLVAALRTVAADVGESILSALQSPQPPPAEAILTILLNEIAALPHDIVLVLDDYHLIDALAVDEAISFWIERQPPQLHLVIATRADPQLPLARLRARAQLTELRAADLRFTVAEAAEFFQSMSLSLTAEDVKALEGRAEGWIVGLQLAALSMQGQRDVSAFIRSFAGDHRYILDYLVEEVLAHQPAAVRSFLLQTAILERLNGALCDAVTGQYDGNARLEALERGNFFVTLLDDRRQWYRYHHLFAQALYARLVAEQPEQLATLHRRASEWYEHNGLTIEAIRHALAAMDFARAAGLIEWALPEMRRSRQDAMLLGWLKALPDRLLRVRPVLSATYAGALLANGELAGVADRLRDAEQWLEPSPDMPEQADAPAAAMVVVDKAALQRLPGSLVVWRAALALARGDMAGAEQYAWRALKLVAEDDHLERGSAAGLLALTAWSKGDLDTAYRMWTESMALLRLAGYTSDAVGCAIALADILIAQGRLREAQRTYERGLQLATEQPAGTRRSLPAMLRGAADMYVGTAELQREYNDLDAAREQLLHSAEIGEHMGLRQNPYRRSVAMARLREAVGDLDGALDLLGEAERLYVSDFYPNVHPIVALKAQVWIRQGRLNRALDWMHEQSLSVEDELSYLREFEHITLARLLLAQYASDGAEGFLQQALRLLERLHTAAHADARTGSVIAILVLQSLAQQMRGDIPAALLALRRALTLAEPEGYVRIFVDEGAAMRVLLQEATRDGTAHQYAGQLLKSFGTLQNRISQDSMPRKQVLPEPVAPLSERELQVLRLLGSELRGPEIARELMISSNTMNTHTKNIYSKLGVNNRRAAVRRAEELHLL